LFALFVCLSFHAPRPVTVDSVAPLATIAKELANQSGVPVEVAKNVTSHTLIVHVNGKPLTEVLQQIAWVTFSKITPVGEGFRIERDSAAEREGERRYRAKLVTWYKDAVGQLAREYLGKDFDTPSAIDLINKQGEERTRQSSGRVLAANLRAKEHLEPGARAGVALLASIPPDSLLSDRPGYRTYALYPRGVERPLKGMEQVMARYLEERKTLAGARGNLSAAPKVRQALLGTPLLCSPESWDVILHAFDDKGDLCEQADVLPWEEKPFSEPPRELLEAIAPDTPVALTATSRAVLKAWDELDSNSMRRRLQDPVANDPQSTLMADVWRSYAEVSHRDLVLDLPDAWLVRVPTQTRAMPSLAEAVKALWPVRSQVAGNWLVGGPPVAEPGWGWQIPRPELSRLLKDLSDPNVDRLEVALNFLQRVRLDRMPLEYTPYLELAGVGDSRPVFDAVPPFMAFYGSLAPEVRKRWRTSGKLPVSTNGESAELLRAWAVSQGVTRLDDAGRSINLSLLESRGCEAIQNPPRQAILTVVENVETRLQARYLNRGRMVQLSQPVPQFSYWSDPKKRPAAMLVRPVLAKQATFSALMPGGWQVVAKVDYGLLPKGAYVPFEQLPAEILKEIRETPKNDGDER